MWYSLMVIFMVWIMKYRHQYAGILHRRYIRYALDMDNGKVYFAKNGTWINQQKSIKCNSDEHC